MSAGDGFEGGPDDLLVVALARGASYADAGAAAGVSVSTVARRMGDLTFRRRVSQVRGRLVDEACGQAAAALAGAVATLVDLLDSSVDAVRLGAASRLIDCSLRLREQSELEARVAELEEHATLAEVRAIS